MTDAFKYLCLLMDMDNPRISTYEASMWPDDGFQGILSQGFLHQVENAEYVKCPECLDHQEEVVCVNYPDGSDRWFMPCPEHGRTEIEPHQLKQWAINFDAVARSLAHQMNLKGACTELVLGHVWRLGRWNVSGGVRDILFAVRLHTATAENCRRAITGAHRPVVLIPHQPPANSYWNGKMPPLISLYAAAEFKDDQIVMDAEYVLDVVRQENLEPAFGKILSPEELRIVIRRMIRTEGQNEVTDEMLLQAVKTCGSVRKAAKLLTEQLKQDVSKDKVQRAVDRAGGIASVATGRDSDSVVRSRSKNRRDTTPDRPD
jgi:hypothetical protein